MNDQLQLIFTPEKITQRLRGTLDDETTAAVKTSIGENDQLKWIESCKTALRSNDLMKVDALLSYRVVFDNSVVDKCLREINAVLMDQFRDTHELLASPQQKGTDAVSKYFRYPVFHELLKQLQEVNTEIYNQQFQLFLEVEFATKEEDKARILKLQLQLPLSELQREELTEKKKHTQSAKEINDSKNYYPLWISILLIIFFIARMVWRFNR